MPTLISVADAQRAILERTRRLDPERVPIERAFGRVLADAAEAKVDLPPFPSSAMDGYALRSGDCATAPTELVVVGDAAAGRPSPRGVGVGEAVAISTGGVVPEGADAVVPVELTERRDGRVEVRQPVAAGANVRPRGGDVAVGATLLEPGARLGAAQVGALAAAGIAEIQCAKRPRVGILVTGTELQPPGRPLGPGEIYESNGLMLAAALTSAGAVPAQLGVVQDDLDSHRKAMEKALLGFDMLVTSGGASVGPHDLVREAQAALRVEEVFWGVAMKPGKPVAFGVRRDHLVFNLPGNPVSALVCFELLVRPAVNALLGLRDPLPAFSLGVIESSVRRNAERDEYLRATRRIEGERIVVAPLAGQESHMIASAGRADTLAHIASGSGEVEAGSEVAYLPLG